MTDERKPTIATCGDCGRSWDDSIPTSMTPAPSARCPFEAFEPGEPIPADFPVQPLERNCTAGCGAVLMEDQTPGRCDECGPEPEPEQHSDDAATLDHARLHVLVWLAKDGSPVVQIDTDEDTDDHDRVRVYVNDARATGFNQ